MKPAHPSIEAIAEIIEIVVQGVAPGARRVEVCREPALGFADAQLHRGAALDDARRKHLPNDGPCELTVAWPADEFFALSDAAVAWGVDADQLHHLGGRLVLVLLWIAIVNAPEVDDIRRATLGLA